MSSSSAKGKGKKIDNDGFPKNRKTQSVVFVAPLNSVPYLGPSGSYVSPMSTNKSNDNADKASPAVIFLPPESSHQEINGLAAQIKTGVVLTGSAALGKIGPAIGLLDVAEADDSYFFRVSLPGVSQDEKEFTCDIEEDGMIMIKGATMTGEKTVCRDSQVFQMLTQNLCPPGHFTISFRLPGKLSKEDFICNFRSDGVLEGIVKKVDKTSECELYFEDTDTDTDSLSQE